jgi:predicted metal-dependent peptidase
MAKLSAEQRVQKSHVALMNDPKYCLYSGIFMLGRTEVDDDLPTACTDGRNTYYGRKFVDSLKDSDLKGLILHENLHKAFRHTTVWKHLYKKDPKLANMACDFVINLMIHDSDPYGASVSLPEGGCLDEKYRGMDAGSVFRLLQQDKEDGKSNGKGDGSGEDEQAGGQGFDEHDWEGADALSEDEKQALAREVDQALRQGALLAGKLNGNVPREITEAMEAKVNWKEVLRDFVNSICNDKDNSTWRRPNRRWVDQDVYMPSAIGEAVGRIVVAIDTSGSIGHAEIGQFLGELVSICNHVQPEHISLTYWDTEVCAHEKYERGEYESIMTSTKPAGGGGTDVNCVFKFVEEHKLNPECILILTDGYTPWPTKLKYPTLFGITSHVIAPIGKTVTISQ